MTVELALLISVLSVIVSIVSVAAAIFFSSKNSKRTDTKDIEERVRENTRILTKLDDISDSIKEIKADNAVAKAEMQQHGDRLLKAEFCINQFKAKFAEQEERCKECGGKCHE